METSSLSRRRRGRKSQKRHTIPGPIAFTSTLPPNKFARKRLSNSQNLRRRGKRAVDAAAEHSKAAYNSGAYDFNPESWPSQKLLSVGQKLWSVGSDGACLLAGVKQTCQLLTLALQRVWAAYRPEGRPSGGVTPPTPQLLAPGNSGRRSCQSRRRRSRENLRPPSTR
jgi:hypothetical protein